MRAPDAARELADNGPPAGLGRLRLDRDAVALLAAVCRRHRLPVAATITVNLLAVVFESSTIAFLLLALQTLAGTVGATAGLPLVGPAIARLAPGLGRDGVFLALVLLAVAAQLLVSGLGFAGRVVVAWLQARVEGDLRSRVFRQLMRISFPEVRRHQVGDLASYNDQINYVGHVIQLGNLVVSQALMAAAYVVMLALLSWPMTLVAVAGAAGLSALLGRVLARIRALGRKFTRASVALNARTVEFLNGLRLVRTFGREAYAIERVDEAIHAGVGHRRRALTWHATIGPATEALTTIGVAVFLIGGYLLLYDGRTEALPRLIAFLVVIYRLLPRVKFINDRLGHVSSYWEFVRRVAGILRDDNKRYVRQGGVPFAGLERGIELRDVSLRYVEGEAWALRRLSFELPRGAMVALVGESGAGKSSVADLLIGLYEPTEGEILIDGRPLGQLDWLSWRRRLAMVSQETFVLNATVRDNVAFGRLEASDEEIRRAVEAAGAGRFVDALGQGYETLLGEHGFRLSGGQRQRLAIARAVLRDPEILILDEATSQLDSESERQIQQALARLRAQRTLLVIAHRLSTVTAADRILVLEKGRLVEQGSHAELLAQDGRYARFWRLQSGDGGRV